jgi:hypothetical protein
MTLEGNHMRAVPWLLIILSTLCLGAAQQRTYTAKYLTDFPGPQVYKDTVTGALLYVESDGRHVAAISRDGKLLWSRDPFKDAHLEFYRTEKPQIVYIGPARKSDLPPGEKRERLVGIVFNNSQSGVMKISNGEFYFLGQD